MKPEVYGPNVSRMKSNECRVSYHLWEDLVIDDLLGQIVNHQWQVVQQAHSQGTIWVAKEPNDYRRQFCIELVCGQF